MKYWIGVVSQEHVLRGVKLEIAQIGHGKRSGLARMHAGDWLVYYSPRENLASSASLQAFTALGQVTDEVIWQAGEGDFHPFRRRVLYRKSQSAPIRPLLEMLSLTAGKTNWGYAFRYGLIKISKEDFNIIAKEMKVEI